MPKLHRLRSKKDFARVFKQGRRASFDPFQIVYCVRAEPADESSEVDEGMPRFGVVISKKTEKSAAKRNLVRRRVKEVLRSLIPTITPSNLDVVFLLSSNAVTLPFARLKEEITTGLNEAIGIDRKRESGE